MIIKEEQLLFSCLCVTENRPAFMPWLLWNYDRQTWANRELIVVDSSISTYTSDRSDIRVVHVSPGTGVAAKRNIATRTARGDFITWFDDDDWQHPEKLALLAEALQDEAVVCAGSRHGWFVDLASSRCVRHRGSGQQFIFNSAGFRRESILPLRFPEKLRKASDTRWMQALRRRFPGQAAFIKREDLFFWLCHRENLSNPSTKRTFPQELEELKAVIGDAWEGTDDALAELRIRLKQTTRSSLPTLSPLSFRGDTPRVTVAIPYYRCRGGIRRAVDSILNQSYQNLQLVVVNDGDPYPPWDILADIDDPRLVRFDLGTNQGRYFADAVVIEATNDPYYLIQDADDWSDPERLEILLNLLIDSNAVAAVSAVRMFRIGEKRGRPYYFPRINKPPPRAFEYRVGHHGLFRTDILRSLGGYYGGYRISYDTLMMNILQLIGTIAYEKRLLYNRVRRYNSLTTNPVTGNGSRRRKQVQSELAGVYSQAYRCYLRHKSGALDKSELVKVIAGICRKNLTYDERELLRKESERLRTILSTGSTDFQTPQAEDRLRILLNDSRLQWDADWRPSRTTAQMLVEQLVALRPRRILEIGSGSTTALLAAYAQSKGASVTTLEHIPRFYYKTMQLLDLLGLSRIVDLCQVEIQARAVGNSEFHWYNFDAKEQFDFIFIDGPPRKVGREGALYSLGSALTPKTEIWLHDGLRQHEQDCIKRWRNNYDFDASLVESGKGVWILRNLQPIRVEEECLKI